MARFSGTLEGNKVSIGEIYWIAALGDQMPPDTFVCDALDYADYTNAGGSLIFMRDRPRWVTDAEALVQWLLDIGKTGLLARVALQDARIVAQTEAPRRIPISAIVYSDRLADLREISTKTLSEIRQRLSPG